MHQSIEPPDNDSPRPASPMDADNGSADAASSGFPAYVTTLIGRTEDREQLRNVLIHQGNRMVVVTGSGGIGKTRLAVQVANDLQEQFRDGTRFLSFASVPRNADLDAAFAWHLGLHDVQHQSHRETIREHLQFRQQLLVVDNAEHVPDLAGLLVYIQTTCPGVSMIVTSRSALGIYGEIVHPLQPLSVRPGGTLMPEMQPDSIARSPAIQLFRERVRAVVPNFEVTEANARDVAAICDYLGGIPLALELTAPRMLNSTPAELLADLGPSLESTPIAIGNELKQPISLQDTMLVSYDQLTTDEQRVFRVLSLMRGHWTVDDVLPLLTPDIDEMDAITHIDSLVTRSLIYSPTGATEEMRFTINPVLQHFGRNWLAGLGEEREIADRHAERMIELAEQAEPELTGKHQQAWFIRINALHEDFRQAHQHLLANDRPVDALRLSTCLWRYAFTRGHYVEGRRWIESSLARVAGHEELRCRAYNGIGFLANTTGDVEGTREAHQQALQLASRIDLHREMAVARIGLGDVENTYGDTAKALRHLEIAAGVYEHLQDSRGLAGVLTNQGNIQWHLGDLQRAFTTHEEARALYAQTSDIRGVAWSDTNTGRIASQQHRYHDAVPRLLTALEGYISIGDAHGLTEILEALAGVAVGTDDLETASLLAGAAMRMRATMGAPLKSPDFEEFQETLAAARRCPDHGEMFARGEALSPEEALAIARAIASPPAPSDAESMSIRQIANERFGITAREYQVLTMLGEGLTDQQIADQLALSRRTVQTYTMSIARKLGAQTRVTIVRAAHQAGILASRSTTDTEPDDR